jgi:RNA 2',3'-cyclic 3'-phosphodiesterase
MARGATARLFVAVDPPQSVREQLLAWARGAATRLSAQRPNGALGELRVLEPEALHVTLCFLGSRPVGEVEVIGSALLECDRGVGELEVGAPLWLPPRRPRVLAVEVHDRGGGLTRLQASVARALTRATGWEAERRRFKAHLTVARTRGRPPSRRAAASTEPALPATPQVSFSPSAMILYRSWLSRAGASYEPLATYVLEAGGL